MSPFGNIPGKRFKGNVMKVGQKNNGQFTVTIPKKLALAAGIKKGTPLEFEWIGNVSREDCYKRGCMLISPVVLNEGG